MDYKIMKGDEVVNTIVADPPFVEAYCAENGFTFEKIEGGPPETTLAPDKDQDSTVWDELDSAYQEGVNGAYDS